jgi:hypothetical protein
MPPKISTMFAEIVRREERHEEQMQKLSLLENFFLPRRNFHCAEKTIFHIHVQYLWSIESNKTDTRAYLMFLAEERNKKKLK